MALVPRRGIMPGARARSPSLRSPYGLLGGEPGRVSLRTLRPSTTIEVIVDNAARASIQEAIANRVVSDFDLMRTRLLRPQTRELSTAIDRLRSEAELRAAIGAPLIGLAVVLAAQTNTVAWLSGVLAIGVLFLEALRRRREAGDMLLDALGDRVASPALERLDADTRRVMMWIDQDAGAA